MGSSQTRQAKVHQTVQYARVLLDSLRVQNEQYVPVHLLNAVASAKSCLPDLQRHRARCRPSIRP